MLEQYDFTANTHLYRWKDMNILLDVNSGAIHILDELSNCLLSNIIKYQGSLELAVSKAKELYPEAGVLEAVEEIRGLESMGALFSQAEVPEVDLSNLSIKAICLNVAHACNMKCKYCFASQGNFGMKPSVMELTTAKVAMEFLIQQSGSIKNLEVDFFGGEPLLIADTIKELVAYCRQREKETGKHFNFTLTTNAVLLSQDIMDWIKDHDISVILSLDGRPETNDRHRLLNSGEGSYNIILPRIQEMIARKPVSYYTRGTFTRKNLDFAEDLKHLISLGFDCISLEPAVGPANGFSIQEEDLPRVLEEYEKLTDILWEQYQQGFKVDFYHFNLNLQQGSCLAKRVTGCGAGIEYVAITPEGDIYPCHQFVGDHSYIMGNIWEGVNKPEIRSRFENNQLKDKECTSCWARYFCGGGCHANANYRSKDMKVPHKVSCTMHRKRIEAAIYLDLQKQLILAE